MTTLWWLLVAHALCDFPLQGDFLARAKNHKAPIPGIHWLPCLIAHSVIQGGGVAFVTGSIAFGTLEAVAHFFTDYGKNEGWYGFTADQVFHVSFLVGIAISVRFL